jgi:hypothetical protein
MGAMSLVKVTSPVTGGAWARIARVKATGTASDAMVAVTAHTRRVAVIDALLA